MTAPLPDFLGLGTQKGGTTTLHRLLEQHPDVYLPACKEVHFFDQNHDAGEGWYRNHFADAEPNQTCEEITPSYLFHSDVPGRIHNLLPKARLVVLLRIRWNARSPSCFTPANEALKPWSQPMP